MADTPPTLTLQFEDADEYAILCAAAAMADRTPEAFVLEEAMHLAHLLVTTGALRHVRLARDAQAETAAFIDAFSSSAAKHAPVAAWAARQAAPPRAPTLAETQAWAEALHADQTDAAGAPYPGHLARAAAHLARLFPDAGPAERHAVWLHDCMEDQGVTAADLRARGYGARVIEIVEAVTRPRDGTSYADWIAALAAGGDAGAIRVKLADLADNADPDRLAQLPPARRASLAERYARARAVLEQALRR